jgi:hypothetical protein
MKSNDTTRQGICSLQFEIDLSRGKKVKKHFYIDLRYQLTFKKQKLAYIAGNGLLNLLKIKGR